MFTLEQVQDAVQHEVSRDLSGHINNEDLRILAYMGLAEETGEVCGLMKRQLRGSDKDRQRATEEHFVEELGDVLWYLAMCCYTEGFTMDQLWEYNRKKLEDRYGRN